MEVDSFLVNGFEEAITNANLIKEMVLTQMLNDNVINEEQFETYNTEWNIVVVKTSWYKKWFKNTKNGYVYKLVKFLKV